MFFKIPNWQEVDQLATSRQSKRVDFGTTVKKIQWPLGCRAWIGTSRLQSQGPNHSAALPPHNCSDKGLMLKMSALKLFTVANLYYQIQLIRLNYPVIPSHQCSTTVSLETYPLYSFTSTLPYLTCNLTIYVVQKYF